MSDWLLCSFCAKTMYQGKEKIYYFQLDNRYICEKCREEWIKETDEKNEKDEENE